MEQREGQRTIKMGAQLGGTVQAKVCRGLQKMSTGELPASRYLCAGSRDVRIFPHASARQGREQLPAGPEDHIFYDGPEQRALDECGKWLAFRLFLHLAAHRVSLVLLCLYKYARIRAYGYTHVGKCTVKSR